MRLRLLMDWFLMSASILWEYMISALYLRSTYYSLSWSFTSHHWIHKWSSNTHVVLRSERSWLLDSSLMWSYFLGWCRMTSTEIMYWSVVVVIVVYFSTERCINGRIAISSCFFKCRVFSWKITTVVQNRNTGILALGRIESHSLFRLCLSAE